MVLTGIIDFLTDFFIWNTSLRLNFSGFSDLCLHGLWKARSLLRLNLNIFVVLVNNIIHWVVFLVKWFYYHLQQLFILNILLRLTLYFISRLIIILIIFRIIVSNISHNMIQPLLFLKYFPSLFIKLFICLNIGFYLFSVFFIYFFLLFLFFINFIHYFFLVVFYGYALTFELSIVQFNFVRAVVFLY